jgi:hypothetical protein
MAALHLRWVSASAFAHSAICTLLTSRIVSDKQKPAGQFICALCLAKEQNPLMDDMTELHYKDEARSLALFR